MNCVLLGQTGTCVQEGREGSQDPFFIFVPPTMSFHLVYAIVLGAVTIPFYTLCIVLLFLKRNNKFIRARNPVFMLIQAVGVVELTAVTTFCILIYIDFFNEHTTTITCTDAKRTACTP